MAVKKFVVGIFTDEEVLFPAIKRVRQAGYKIHDVYTPMPIHGMDAALGLRDTSLHTAGFIYGITGTTTALSGIGWVFNSDWPVNIGGKSHFDLPAWIPITFELTVLFSAVGMVLTLPTGALCSETSFQPSFYGRPVHHGDRVHGKKQRRRDKGIFVKRRRSRHQYPGGRRRLVDGPLRYR
jgi:hypothetical protein